MTTKYDFYKEIGKLLAENLDCYGCEIASLLYMADDENIKVKPADMYILADRCERLAAALLRIAEDEED